MSQAEKTDLITRWQSVKSQLPSTVTLLAVSKTKPSEMIKVLAGEGQCDFGENYVQEAIAKISELKDITANGKPIVWHYIGHIQRNKTKDLATHFDWVHGVDRLIIAERLSGQRPAELAPLNICIQVNIDDEATKSGCQPDALKALITAISQLPNLRLRGLMIIPAKNSQSAFEKTQQLFEQHRQYHANPQDWDTLSMGMSGDVEQAIDAGSTMVRVGTAIFGAR
ncbi:MULTISPECIES: YggS family pyridoxal phosphate-dependent enzyme [unclassified Moraxella]|uniref:YggS family pyridoxal phosphate-dependent enzyme n=1 Tax=unclassified Moraxella TaxID=2685852 RepID=UPI003AF8774B